MRAFVARDKGGKLYLYITRPYKEKYHINQWDTEDDNDYYSVADADLPEGVNPQWSDDEPIEINLKLERV